MDATMKYHKLQNDPVRVLTKLAVLGAMLSASSSSGIARAESPSPGWSGKHELTSYAVLPSSYQIFGHLSFEAAYDSRTSAGRGQIPTGTEAMRYLYVCAWERDSDLDFREVFVHGRSPTSGDDFLGCDTADRDGYYEIDVGADRGDDVYLVTYFCDGPDGGVAESVDGAPPAGVCVRRDIDSYGRRTASQIDTTDGVGTARGWLDPAPLSRKVMWTRTYWNGLDVQAGARTEISWNLSCPDANGLGKASVSCTPSDLPHSDDDDENSNSGYNKEALHVFRAAIEPRKTQFPLVPGANNVAPPSEGGQAPCDTDRCVDEINLHVADTTNPPDSNYCAGKATGGDNSHMASYDRVCVVTPFDAFRTVHEMGHNVQRRWMVMPEDVQIGAGGGESNWKGDTCQKQTLAEGWANFFSTAAWYNSDATDPTYQRRNIEDPHDSDLFADGEEVSSCQKAQGEGRAAQFFWDLYDRHDHDAEQDGIRLTMPELLKIWSMFSTDGKCTNGSKNEGGPHGRNVEDWARHYDERRQYHDPSLPNINELLQVNCMHYGDSAQESWRCEEGESHAGCSVPEAWTCLPGYYAGNDGCHCGCGTFDPDCEGSGTSSCDICNAPGSCSNRLDNTCEGIIQNNNWHCNACIGFCYNQRITCMELGWNTPEQCRDQWRVCSAVCGGP